MAWSPAARALASLSLVLLLLFQVLSPARDFDHLGTITEPPTPLQLAGTLHLHWVRDLPPLTPAWPDQPRLSAIDAAPKPVVAGKTVLLSSSRTDSLTAYDADTGEEKWRFTTNGPIRLAPAVWRERVYVASDDGYLYCLGSEDGELLWKFRGGPSDRKILGNERLISMWPMRAGPVVAEDSSADPEQTRATVYCAAGIWPFMGIFLHALDAQTGQVVWTNDGDGSMYIKQPHMADSFAGIAPQGPLVVAGDRLMVPGGRSVPACYNRHTGKLIHYRLADSSKLGGGPDLIVAGTRFLNGGGLFDLDTGSYLGAASRLAFLSKDLLWSWQGSELRIHNLRGVGGKQDGKGKTSYAGWLPPAVQSLAVPRADVAVQLGGRFFAATEGRVFALDLPRHGVKTHLAWQASIEGQPVHLTAEAERLLVTTRGGRVYCFGVEPRPDKPPFSLPPPPPLLVDEWTDKAQEILKATGVSEGYAVVWGAGSGRLIQELVRQSRLQLVVIEPEQARAAACRAELDDLGYLGVRVAVIHSSCQAIQLPPYLASLMVSENPAEADLDIDGSFLNRLYPSLRPFGGVACLPVPAGRRPELSRLAADLPQARVRDSGAWLLVSREGPLPGSAWWSHEHGDAANTRVSRDQVVKTPLGLLWFGGPSNDAVLPRHGHGPQPQVMDGRLIIEGVDSLRAIDIYTGRQLWETALPGVGKAFDNLGHEPGANSSGSNYVSLADGIYVLLDSFCLRLDPATGKERGRFPAPSLPGIKGPLVWCGLNVAGDYLVGALNPPGGDAKNRRSLAVSSSKFLVVLDRHTGKLLWFKAARDGFRHNSLCLGAGWLYVIDRPSADHQRWFKRNSSADKKLGQVFALDLRTGRQLWTSNKEVFGTWLGYSEKHGVLVECGQKNRDTLNDEPAGMRAYDGKTGKVLWFQAGYKGPALLHGDRILIDQKACDLKTGEIVRRKNPLTGVPEEWTWTRAYGCNTPMASEHLLTFRSGAAGYYDLCGDSGTGNIGGFRSGCTNNLIVAGGLLTAPDYTRTCTCSYQNQTSLALVPMPEAEMWTYQGGQKEIKGVIRRLGLLLGAPGDRKSETGTLWLEYPSVGGPSPPVVVKTVPDKPDYYRRHSSQIQGDGPAWVAASGARGLQALTLTLAGPKDPPRYYTVRLYFAEPDRLPAGQRLFHVRLQDRVMLENFDVSAEAGGPSRILMREFQNIRVGAELTIRLQPATGAAVPVPILSGIEVVEDDKATRQ